jgi:hypothetical protein
MEMEPRFARQPIDRQPQQERSDQIEVVALSRLEGILRRRPDLRQYVDQTSIRGGFHGVRGVRRFLKENPHLVAYLNEIQRDNPEQTALLLCPDYPLVVATHPRFYTAMVPILSCTHSALDHIIRRNSLSRRDHTVVLSNNGLEEYAWNVSEHQRRNTISYDPQSMKPEDYIALAISAFDNEVFKDNIPATELV